MARKRRRRQEKREKKRPQSENRMNRPSFAGQLNVRQKRVSFFEGRLLTEALVRSILNI